MVTAVRVSVSLALAVSVSSALGAQSRRLQPAGVVRTRAAASPTGVHTMVVDSVRARVFPARLLLGTGGAVAGAFIGGVAGAELFGRDCNCDDPGLAQAVVGALVGATVAAAAMSAVPAVGSRCGYLNRFGRALIGSALGAAVGIAVGGGTEVTLLSFPLSTGLGGAFGASSC